MDDSAKKFHCDVFAPCPGNVVEQCGCRKLSNQSNLLPLSADFSQIGIISTFGAMTLDPPTFALPMLDPKTLNLYSKKRHSNDGVRTCGCSTYLSLGKGIHKKTS